MTVQDVLVSFDQMSEWDQRAAVAEILSWSSQWEFRPLEDKELDRLADDAFLSLDEQEAPNEHGAKN